MVSFGITQRIKECIAFNLENRERLSTQQQSLLDRLEKSQLGDEITLNEINALAEMTRKVCGVSSQSKSGAQKSKQAHLMWAHELLEGSEIYVQKKEELPQEV